MELLAAVIGVVVAVSARARTVDFVLRCARARLHEEVVLVARARARKKEKLNRAHAREASTPRNYFACARTSPNGLLGGARARQETTRGGSGRARARKSFESMVVRARARLLRTFTNALAHVRLLKTSWGPRARARASAPFLIKKSIIFWILH